jgi:hypothetical protein
MNRKAGQTANGPSPDYSPPTLSSLTRIGGGAEVLLLPNLSFAESHQIQQTV